MHYSRVARVERVTSPDRLMLELQGERYLRDLCSRSCQNTLLLSEIAHHSMAFVGGKRTLAMLTPLASLKKQSVELHVDTRLRDSSSGSR